MEKDTVILSRKDYDDFTEFRKEIDKGGVVLGTRHYSDNYYNSNYTYYSKDDFHKEMTESYNKLMEDYNKNENIRKQLITDKNQIEFDLKCSNNRISELKDKLKPNFFQRLFGRD